ncbi:hypothetical protein Tco_0859760 [Tanacetum coccineum]|uniref:Reverse transcriptase domain-containing protein n=1 Tax=Tanacetum coccineum TaxID=301880 RepID=A0ABQ5BFX7_9ASTR
MAGYKHNQLMNKSFDDIQKLFDKAMKRVNIFVDLDTKLVEGSAVRTEGTRAEGSSKRAGEELEHENAKKQKVDDDKETAELKSLMEVMPDEEHVALDAIPLAFKSPSIIDWKIHEEGKKSYYQIIRADGSSKMYLVFSHMLKSFNREDLETLYKLGRIVGIESLLQVTADKVQICRLFLDGYGVLDVRTVFFIFLRLSSRMQSIEIEVLKSSTQHSSVNDVFVLNKFNEDVETEPIITLDLDDQPMWESAKTVAPTPNPVIAQPDADDNFVINNTHMKMILENKFNGYLRTDPHDHIREFLAICDMFKYSETQSEAVKLLIFPFSLCDKAKS